MESRHGKRLIEFSAESRWECTCDFFGERNTCSHIMAAETVFGPWLAD
ncbi:SWIM zinc finger family protein [Nonomuraea sp. NPDC004702]